MVRLGHGCAKQKLRSAGELRSVDEFKVWGRASLHTGSNTGHAQILMG